MGERMKMKIDCICYLPDATILMNWMLFGVMLCRSEGVV